MSSPNDIPDDELAHFGVKGMRWGHRKPEDSSGGGSSGPSRAERKEMNRAAKREDNLKLQPWKQKAQDSNDKAILAARARVNRVQQEYDDARSTYKVEKKQIGKVAARRALDKAGDKRAETLAKSDELTKAEKKVYNTLLVGDAITAIIAGDASKASTQGFTDFHRRVQAMQEVEKQYS